MSEFHDPSGSKAAQEKAKTDDAARRLKQRRQKALEGLPACKLTEVNVAGSELLLNRGALLRRLPHGGVVAELGVNEGDFSARILQETAPRTLVLVDVWGNNRYGESKFDHVRSRFDAELRDGRVEIVRKLSTEAAEDFPDGYFDWVYIDTNHSYVTTRDELRFWAPKVKEGGFLTGHDYVMGNWRAGKKYGVIEAVAEFCVEADWRLSHLTADFTEFNSFALTRIR